MKKLFFIVAIFLSTSAMAQSVWQWGLKVGGNVSISQFDMIDPNTATINSYTRPGGWIGGLLDFSPGRADNEYQIQAEVLCNNINMYYPMQAAGQGMNSANLYIGQINIPILFKYYITPYLSINAGPTFNFNLMGEEVKNNSNGKLSERISSSQFNLFQYGATGGLTYYYKRFFVEARFNYLFGTMNNPNHGIEDRYYISDMIGNIKVNTISFGIGYTFKIKRHPKVKESD